MIVRKSHQFRVAEGELPLYVTVISVPGRDEGTVSVGQAVKFVGTVSLRRGFSLPGDHCTTKGLLHRHKESRVGGSRLYTRDTDS